MKNVSLKKNIIQLNNNMKILDLLLLLFNNLKYKKHNHEIF